MKLYFKKSIGPYRKGSVKNVPDKVAAFYIKQGIGEEVVRELTAVPMKQPTAPVRQKQTYQTKVMVAESVPAPQPDPEPSPEPVESHSIVEQAPDPATVPEPAEVDEYEGLDVEELRVLAEMKGIKVHHKAGAEKIKEALKQDSSDLT